MNILCRYIESINFNIKHYIKNNKVFDNYYIYKNNEIKYTTEEANEILKTIEEIKEKLKQKYKENYYNEEEIENNLNIKEEIFKTNNNIYSVVNILVDDCYGNKNNKNLEILWRYYGNIIFENLLKNKKDKIYFPLKSDKGSIKYLGYNYELREIKYE